jgi:hypothetical protein
MPGIREEALRMRSTFSTANLAPAVLVGIAALTCASPALAAEGQAGAEFLRGDSASEAPPAMRYEFDPAQRESWLQDCHQTVAASRPRSGTVREGQGNHGECEAYLADYLARYRQGQIVTPVLGYAAPGYAYVHPDQLRRAAQRRMVSIPVIQAIDSRGEPIAYADDTGIRPARRSIPRRTGSQSAE